MTFEECVNVCAGTRELVREFDRLAGTHLSEIGRRAPIHAMIDEASGRDAAAFRKFVAFVAEFVWAPMLCDAAQFAREREQA